MNRAEALKRVLEAGNRGVHGVQLTAEDLTDTFGSEALDHILYCVGKITPVYPHELQVRFGHDDERNFKGSARDHFYESMRDKGEHDRIIGSWHFYLYKRAFAVHPIPDQGAGPVLVWAPRLK